MEKKPIILKEQIIDSVKISKLIIEKGLEGKKLSQVEDAENNRKLYYEFISSALKQYKSKYNNMSPNMILNEFLKKYIAKNNLDDFFSKGFKFYGQKIVSYEWACIYREDPSVKKRHFSYSPQLFILINNISIKFGFCYGTEVNYDDEIVEIIREDDEIREIIFSVLKRNENINYFSESIAEEFPKQANHIKISNPEDLEINWYEKTQLISYYLENEIPENISELIENTFDDLLEIFKKSSLIDIKDSLEVQCEDILRKKAEKHPKINQEKILEITKLLIEKLKGLNIERSPSVIIFSAGVLWHNVLNRPNDEQYISQEDLDNIFDGGLGGVRYLRKDLGVDKRVYSNLDELISDLTKTKNDSSIYSSGVEDYPNWEIVYNFIEQEILGRSIPNQAVIEVSTFLYFNNDKVYSKNELWEACSPNIEYEGDTPQATFNTELSRYSENSDVQNKRSPLLFTITNLNENSHKIQLIKSIREGIDTFLKTSLQKPYIWEMIKEAAENLGDKFSISDIKQYIRNKYEEVNDKTIEAQIIVCTVNHNSRIHHHENKKPRIANSKYDFLYRIEKGKGDLELYDPIEHGIWEIRYDDSGNLIVATIKPIGTEYIFPKRESLPTNLLDPSEIEKVEKLLKKHKQIILYGPPGTGKTYFAEVLAQFLAENKYELIQFHSSYSYEDFIETIEVKPNSDGKFVTYNPKACILRELCDAASNLDEKTLVILIIDEINRGDLSRIFGELILGLEKSQRNKEIRTPLSDSLGLLRIPHNLLIIGTMNSVDRSIAIVDYALRRRFLFYKMMPEKSVLKKWLEYKNINEDLKHKILNLFKNLNEEIRKDEVRLGEHHQIGHTYFFVETEDELKTSWDYMIEPLLQEYLNFKSEYLKPYKYDELIKDKIKE